MQKNQSELVSIRERIVEGLKGIDNIETLGFLEVRRRMLSICKNDLILLSQNENK